MDDRHARHLGELLDVLRERVAELQISHETLDAVAGWQSGYASKLLCNPPMKRISPFMTYLALQALGLRMIISEDAEALARVKLRLARRLKPKVLGQLSKVYFMAD